MRMFTAGPENAGQRLDVVVAKLYPKLSRSSLEPLFDNGFVAVDGHPAKPAYKLRGNELVAIDETFLKVKPPKLDLLVIYEDDDVMVIDKPAGALTHSKGALNSEATVASFIKPKLTDESLTGNRAGIVHRLDRGTSGVIIAAKTAEAQARLQKQFSQRKAKKTYTAIIEGVPEPQAAIIDTPIGRNSKKPQTFSVQAGGKPARTQYKVVDVFEIKNKTYAKVELKPETGRTHQLRVHMAYIGHPIVGDPVYGRGKGHMMLHAAGLELTLPSGKRQQFDSRLPDRFREFINGQ